MMCSHNGGEGRKQKSFAGQRNGYRCQNLIYYIVRINNDEAEITSRQAVGYRQ